MKRILLPAAAAVIGLAGCVESGLNPEDAVVVKGTALRENKSPVTETTLKLHRSVNSACVLPDHYRDIKTDTVGKYSLELTGAETQNGDLARCFLLSVPPDAKGAGLSVEFLMQVTEIEVPELHVWNGAVAATSSGDGAELTFKKIFDTHSFDTEATLTLRSGGEVAWRAPATSSPVALSAYVLEDALHKAQLHAKREVKGSGVAFHLSYDSDEVALEQKQLVPASRGAACRLGAANHDTGCPYTDGKFTPHAGDAANDLTLTFAQPKKLKKAVLRHFSHSIASQVVLQGSADNGATWTKLAQLAEGDHSYVEVDLDLAAPAVNAFRIHLEGDSDPKIHGLAEVSTFE